MYSDNQEGAFSCLNNNEISSLDDSFIWIKEDKSDSMHSTQD